HELPRPAAHRVLPEIGGGGRRHDCRHRHRQELGEHRQRLGQLDRDGRVAERLDAPHVAGSPGGVILGAREGEQRPGAPAGGRRGIDPRRPRGRGRRRRGRGARDKAAGPRGASISVAKRLTVGCGAPNIRGRRDQSQLRALWLPLLVAVVAAAPLAAQQEPRVVRGLSFKGNHALDNLTLETAIATPKSGYFARQWWLRWLGLGEKRYFDEVEFRRDVVRLVLLYRQSGYMDVVVDTVVRRAARDVWVTFRIAEGEPVRVTRIDIRGLDPVTYDPRKLRRELPLQLGDPFDRYLFQASADTIASRLRNRGFPYAQVLRNFDSDAAAHTAQIAFDVDPGPHVRIGDVQVQGLDRIDTATVLRVLSIRPGDPYRQDQIYQSQRDL